MAFTPIPCVHSVDWNDPVSVNAAQLQQLVCIEQSVQEVLSELNNRDTHTAYQMYSFYFYIFLFVLFICVSGLKLYVQQQKQFRYKMCSGVGDQPPIWSSSRRGEDAAAGMVEV
jgi:hypothetical protein